MYWTLICIFVSRGSIKLSYIIYDPSAPPTQSATPSNPTVIATPTSSVPPNVATSLPYPVANPLTSLPYPTGNVPGSSNTSSSLPYPTASFPGTSPQQPLPYPTHDQPCPQVSEDHGDEESESDSEAELPSGWDRRVVSL